MPRPRLTLVGKPDAGAPPVPGPGADAELALALIRRETGAPFAAFTRLRPVVDGALRRMMGPGQDVADLSQEVFLRFFRQVGTLREPAALRGFVVGICLRVVRRELRHRWLRRAFKLSVGGDPPDVGAVVDVESREVLRHYYVVLERLGGEARSLFVARHVERLPMPEVAALHGMSLSTAQRRLARVVRRVEAMVAADPVLADYVAAAEVVS